MTCIVGIVEKKKVFIGSDNVTICGFVKNNKSAHQTKIFKNGPFIIGSCGACRINDIVKYHFKPPIVDKKMDINKYMITKFIPALTKAFRDNKYLKDDNNVETFNGSLLIGYKNKLFKIDSNFALGENDTNYATIGSAHEVAYGALYVAVQCLDNAIEILNMVLDAATAHSLYIGGKHTIMSTK